MASKTKLIKDEFVKMYYEHQYDRIDKLEGHSINISNIVLTISALIITFGFDNKLSLGPVVVLILPIIIIIVNLFSILYVADRSTWISQHQKRAKRILETYIPELFDLDKETAATPKRWAISRRRIQSLVHYLFILIGVLLLIIFVLEIYGISFV